MTNMTSGASVRAAGDEAERDGPAAAGGPTIRTPRRSAHKVRRRPRVLDDHHVVEVFPRPIIAASVR
jgi:hypothetical protein